MTICELLNVEPIMNNPRFSVHPHQGQPLPPNWKEQAKQRAASAEENYMQALHNAWRGNGSVDPNTMRQCRLAPTWSDILGQK
jgi:hypothetical protein